MVCIYFYFQDFPKALKMLFMNPVFMFLTLAGCSEGLATAGFATFLPKFIQNQFTKTPANAAFLTGKYNANLFCFEPFHDDSMFNRQAGD